MDFVDLANVQKAVRDKENNGFRLEYYRPVNELAGSRRLIGAYVFDAVSVTNHSNFDPNADSTTRFGFRAPAWWRQR